LVGDRGICNKIKKKKILIYKFCNYQILLIIVLTIFIIMKILIKKFFIFLIIIY